MRLRPEQRSKATSWGVPTAYAAAAVVLGIAFPRIEHGLFGGFQVTISAPAAMAVCSSIASGMISLTGIVFSLTFVMVQFSATAYSPRLVLWIARDPVVAHAMGIFSATFLYALLVLGWVDRNDSGRVPALSGWLVLVLLLASMGVFIALIGRIGLLQVGRMLVFTGDQGRQAIADSYGAAAPAVDAGEADRWRSIPVTRVVAHAGRPQVIQALDLPLLLRRAGATGSVIEVAAAVGDTVMDGAPLLRVHGGRDLEDVQGWRNGVVLGDERTFEQDPKYAIRLVVDIAIKALSPAINDPTTAVQALDQIEDLLLRLGRCELDRGVWTDREGRVRVVTQVPGWDDFLLLALDEIRAYGAASVQVMRRMMALIKNLVTVLPEERHPGLRHWERRLQSSIERSFPDAEEKRDAAVADRQGLGLGEDPGEPAPGKAPEIGASPVFIPEAPSAPAS